MIRWRHSERRRLTIPAGVRTAGSRGNGKSPEERKIPSNKVSVSLGRNDWGQVIEGLESRRASWEVTARYLEGEAVDEAIEACDDAGDARALVATHDRLIGELRSQA